VDTTNQIKMQRPEFMANVDVADNYKCNGIYFRLADPTVPGYPIKFIIKRALKHQLNLLE